MTHTHSTDSSTRDDAAGESRGFRAPYAITYLDATTAVFDTLLGAAEHLRHERRLGGWTYRGSQPPLGEHFSPAPVDPGQPAEEGAVGCICRDLFGRPVLIDAMSGALDDQRHAAGDHHPARRRRKGAAPGESGFRAEIVPGTGRWHRAHQFRRPATTAELRATDERELTDLGVRLRRVRLDLPNAWDDISRRDRKDRSWKRHRRTQWKPSHSDR